jgi:NAD(P)H-dependent flavin oxidoreductase YrpB (nitropropane dioxygenase family)
MFKVQDDLCAHCNFCGSGSPKFCYPARTAVHGLEGNFPSNDQKENTSFGRTQSAGEQYLPGQPRFKALRDVCFVPELMGTERVAKREELGKEPLYVHCRSEAQLGGFQVKTPVIIAAMGSTPVANTLGVDLSRAAAQGGFVNSIGENILNMWGYEERIRADQPSLKDRIRGFTKHVTGAQGGIVVQQNVEDDRVGVWKRVYADPELREFFEAGLIGFEAKGGQGAKPGMGGEVKLPRDRAQALYNLYHFPVNPFEVEQSLYQRHSVPGTVTPESMEAQLRGMCEAFPLAQIWWKTGPYGDLMTQIEILDHLARQTGRRMHITIDGTEGGTGMSPLGPMNDMGLPTLTCLLAIAKAKQRGFTNIDYSLAGGLVTGRDLSKAMALGADGAAFGKAFLVAAMAGRANFTEDEASEVDHVVAGARGCVNYALEGMTNEARMLISSVGRYDFQHIKPGKPYPVNGQTVSTIDVISLDAQVAQMFNLLYAYDPNLWDKLSAATEELRRRCVARGLQPA